ncbi:unnamed protein product [Ixodes pacificus]
MNMKFSCLVCIALFACLLDDVRCGKADDARKAALACIGAKDTPEENDRLTRAWKKCYNQSDEQTSACLKSELKINDQQQACLEGLKK